MKMSRKSFLRTLGGAALGGGLGMTVPARLLRASELSGEPPRGTAIKTVEVFPCSLPLKGEMRIALATPMTADNVLVRLVTAEGAFGWGESSPYSAVMNETQASDLAIAKSLAGIVQGRDAFTIPRIVEAMDSFSPGNPGIKAAFEMALWDICGKIARQPVYRLLGAYRDRFETDQTVYLDKPEAMAKKAAEIAGRGFKDIKVKLGEAPEVDVEKIRRIREALGGSVRLRVDANQGWLPAIAVRALRALAAYDLQFCEQPVAAWDWAGLKFVRSNSAVPIMADEAVHRSSDAILGIRQDAMDMINIKLMKTGSILEAARIAQIAEAANIPCMMGCMNESRVALTAAAHVVCSQRNIRYADLDAFLEHQVDPVIGGMRVDGGVVKMPEIPGLGLDIDPGFLKKLRPI
jgi:L-Ala-D/L-Glu epimerase